LAFSASISAQRSATEASGRRRPRLKCESLSRGLELVALSGGVGELHLHPEGFELSHEAAGLMLA
jgi:hypothetical protein